MNITVDRAVIEQAVEALEEAENVLTWDGFQKAADALRVALEQPEQELMCAHGIEKTKCSFCRQPEQEPVAKAWDEGYRQGVEDERTSEANIGIAGFGAKVEPARQNPYGAAPPQRKPLPNCAAFMQTTKRKAMLFRDCGKKGMSCGCSVMSCWWR